MPSTLAEWRRHYAAMALADCAKRWRELRKQNVPAGSATQEMRALRSRLAGSVQYWTVIYEEDLWPMK